jgi:hypothetical protein
MVCRLTAREIFEAKYRGFMAGYDEGFGRRGRNNVPDQWRDRGGYQSNPA